MIIFYCKTDVVFYTVFFFNKNNHNWFLLNIVICNSVKKEKKIYMLTIIRVFIKKCSLKYLRDFIYLCYRCIKMEMLYISLKM